MSLDKYITERELRQLQEENCDKIDKYRLARKTIKCWYDELGLKYPHSSENNFRDSWFHFRKVYQEHSLFEMIGQTATLDEHLHRAEKDSVVFFFQEICEILEFWYSVNELKLDFGQEEWGY